MRYLISYLLFPLSYFQMWYRRKMAKTDHSGPGLTGAQPVSMANSYSMQYGGQTYSVPSTVSGDTNKSPAYTAQPLMATNLQTMGSSHTDNSNSGHYSPPIGEFSLWLSAWNGHCSMYLSRHLLSYPGLFTFAFSVLWFSPKFEQRNICFSLSQSMSLP